MARDNGQTGRRDAMGFGLALLNRLAGTPIVHRLGLFRPVQQAVFQVTRAGFRTTAAAGRTFQAAQSLARPARLPTGPARFACWRIPGPGRKIWCVRGMSSPSDTGREASSDVPDTRKRLCVWKRWSIVEIKRETS